MIRVSHFTHHQNLHTYETSLFQCCNHMLGSSVQCSVGTGNHEVTVHTHADTHMNTQPAFPLPPSVQSSRASSSATSVGSGVTFSLPDESPQGLSQGGMPGRLDAIIESQCLESPPPEDQHHALHRQSSVYDSTTTYKLFQKAMQVGKR